MKFVKHKRANVEICVSDIVCSPKIIDRILAGSYEIHEVLFAERILKSNDRVLELGAGLGLVSTVVCKNVQPLFYAAVEADERLIPYIRNTHLKNSVEGIELIEAVLVTDPVLIQRGSVEFGTANPFWGSSINRAGATDTTTIAVEAVDANLFIRENKVNALISDIEGGELELLRSLDFSGLDKIILETHPSIYGQSGMHEIFSTLNRNGFVYNAPNSRGQVVSFERIGVGRFSSI